MAGVGGLDTAGWACPSVTDRSPDAVLDEVVAVDVPDMAAQPAVDDRGETLGVLIVALGVGVRATRDRGVEASSQDHRSVRSASAPVSA